MSDKELADIICRALLAIVSGIRKRYGLPEYHNIVISVNDVQTLPPVYDSIMTVERPDL